MSEHIMVVLFNILNYASRLSIVQSRVEVSKESSYRELPVVTEKRYISLRPSLVFQVYVISLISKSLPAQRNLSGLMRYGRPKDAMTLMPSFTSIYIFLITPMTLPIMLTSVA